MLQPRPPVVGPQLAKHLNNLRRGQRLLPRRHAGQRVEGPVGSISIQENHPLIASSLPTKIRDQITVGIEDGEAPSGAQILERHRPKQGGLSGPRLADDVEMRSAVCLPNPEGSTQASVICGGEI